MRHIINALEKLGLSSNEVQIYLTSLEYGWLTALGISRLTKLPRTTVYMLLEKLQEKWYFHVRKLWKTTAYHAISGDEILDLLDKQLQSILKKKDEISTNMYVLNNMTKARTQLPHIQFYDGDGVYDALTIALKSARNIKMLYHIQKTMFVDSDDSFSKLLATIRAAKNEAQILLVDTPRAQGFAKRTKDPHVAIKILPHWFFLFSQQIITDLWYYHITYWDKVYMMEIIDPLYLNSQKTQFDILRTKL
jgi:predicted DNA-binding transcriptional regulator